MNKILQAVLSFTFKTVELFTFEGFPRTLLLFYSVIVDLIIYLNLDINNTV